MKTNYQINKNNDSIENNNIINLKSEKKNSRLVSRGIHPLLYFSNIKHIKMIQNKNKRSCR